MIVLSILLHILSGAFWLLVLVMQTRMRDLAGVAEKAGATLPVNYHVLFWTWFALGFPAFGVILGILWLMITRPALPWFG